jgi:hypothetical protein
MPATGEKELHVTLAYAREKLAKTNMDRLQHD